MLDENGCFNFPIVPQKTFGTDLIKIFGPVERNNGMKRSEHYQIKGRVFCEDIGLFFYTGFVFNCVMFLLCIPFCRSLT